MCGLSLSRNNNSHLEEHSASPRNARAKNYKHEAVTCRAITSLQNPSTMSKLRPLLVNAQRMQELDVSLQQ